MSNSKINIDYADIVSKAIMPHGWKSLIPLYDTYKLLEPVIDKIIQSAALVDGDDGPLGGFPLTELFGSPLELAPDIEL